MAMVYQGRNRAFQSSTTATTGGTIFLTAVAPAGYFNFRDLYANGAVVALELQDATNFEYSYGTMTYGGGDASTDSIVSRVITESSNGPLTPVAWGAGTRNAYGMAAAEEFLLRVNALAEMIGREAAARGHLGLGTAAVLNLDGAKVVSFDSGTAVVFYQAAAPTGWTKSTAQNDKALRIVSGATGGSAGGTRPLSSATVGGTAITASQVAQHAHNVPGYTGSFGVGGNVAFHYDLIAAAGDAIDTGLTPGSAGAAHDHALALAYADVIICTKD